MQKKKYGDEDRTGMTRFIVYKDNRCSMASVVATLLSFVVALVISTIVIYVITRLFGETEDFKTALIAALVGTAVYTIIYYVIGDGLIAAFIAGIVWLLALKYLYSIGWLKSLLIAVVVWVVTSVVGWFLPGLTGPL